MISDSWIRQGGLGRMWDVWDRLVVVWWVWFDAVG